MERTSIRFVIFEGTRAVAWIEASAKVAFRAARAYVRAMAHAAGDSSPERIEYPRGRVSVARGNFRSVNERRQ